MTPLEARLDRLAAAGHTITYGALARDMGWTMAMLTATLEGLMDIDTGRGAPLRAALCEGRLAGGQPARGFFDKAALLGHDLSDPVAMVAAHRQALFDAARPDTSPP